MAARVAGVLACGSGVAYLAYLPTMDDRAITAWNLLIVPAAIVLGILLAPLGAVVAAGSTAAGVAASLLWAFSYASPRLEPWWIGLAGAWWLGVGWLLARTRWRRLGRFTLVLGVATVVDLVLTVLDAPMPIYALGGFKLPLSMIWSFWVGAALLRSEGVGPTAGG